MVTAVILAIIYLSFISLGLPDSILGSAWPSMYASLSVPLHYAGIISMIIAGGTVVSSISSARIIKRFGTGTVTAFSVFLTAAALIGFSFSRRFFLLCLCAIPLGLGAGSVDAALNNYVALHYKAKHMNWLHCFWGIGASTGPLIISALLIKYNSWNAGYRAIGMIQCSLVILLFITLPLWKKGGGGGTGGQKTKQAPLKINQLFQITGVKQALITFFCYCTIESTAGLWGSSYLVTVRNIPAEIAARWIALYFIGITLGRLMSGFLSIRLNNRRMIRLGQCLIACGIVILSLPGGNNMLLPGFLVIGLGCAPIFPGLLHETPENFGKEHSQAIMGIQMASAYAGTTLMPPLFGKIASYAGFGIFPAFMGIMLAVKITMTEILHKKIDRLGAGRPQ
jgi:fucose permease